MRLQLGLTFTFLLLGALAGSLSVSQNSFIYELSGRPWLVPDGFIQANEGSQDVSIRQIESNSLAIDRGELRAAALGLSGKLSQPGAAPSESAALLHNNLGLAYLLASRTISDPEKRLSCLKLSHELFQSSRREYETKRAEMTFIPLINDERTLRELSSFDSRWYPQASKCSREARAARERSRNGERSAISL